LVIELNGKAENTTKYKVLKRTQSYIVLKQENLLEIEPWILALNLFIDLSFYIRKQNTKYTIGMRPS
jgi:hypothetical protein